MFPMLVPAEANPIRRDFSSGVAHFMKIELIEGHMKPWQSIFIIINMFYKMTWLENNRFYMTKTGDKAKEYKCSVIDISHGSR